MIPSLGGDLPIDAILDRLDGILFTGSPSNVEPHLYAGQPSELGTHHDPKRDATTLPLIHAAIAAGVPVLGICRGFQEMNVAFGGSLHQKLHEVGGFIEHREDKTASLDVQYGASHSITVEPGGLFTRPGAVTLQRLTLYILKAWSVWVLGCGQKLMLQMG